MAAHESLQMYFPDDILDHWAGKGQARNPLSLPLSHTAGADDIEGGGLREPGQRATLNAHFASQVSSAEGATGPALAEGPPPDDSGSRFKVAPVSPLHGGFNAARRHSAWVRLFRRLAVGGSIGIAVLISTALLVNPLRRLPVDVSIGKVAVVGTKITVESPIITGIQRDGRPFDIRARTGLQDIANPNIIELQDIDSKIGAGDDATTLVRASKGVYDSQDDRMVLEGEVEIKNSTGYDMHLSSARIDFKTGGLASELPVKVVLDGGTIAAKSLDVSDNGHKVSFDGDVTSVIETRAGDHKTTQTPGGPGL